MVSSVSRETELIRAMRQLETEKAANAAAAAERQWLSDNFGVDEKEARSIQSAVNKPAQPSAAQRVKGKSVGKVGRAIEDEAVKSIADLIYLGLALAGVTGLALIMFNLIVVGSWIKRAQDSGSVGVHLLQTTLGLNIPFISGGKASQEGQASSATGEAVAKAALAWAGQDFKPGQTERCADFVRHVLDQAGVAVGVAKGSAGPLMADSFWGDELGELIYREKDLRPGDIVMFKHTYNGPGRFGITHVGIFVGPDGMIIDRPTAAKPVQHRSMDVFKDFAGALRPSAYATAADVGSINMDALMEAVKSQESGGNSQAVNTRTGAAGAWQILPSNIPSWSQQCLGRQVTVSQFLASTPLQQNIVKCKLSEYAQTHSAKASSEDELVRRVAATWYSGNGDLYDNGRRQGPGGTEPSIREYTQSILAKYKANL